MGVRVLRWSAVALLAGLIGCGGPGTTTPGPGPGPGGGDGRVAGNLGSEAGGALVRLEGTNQTAVCAPDGSFQFEGVPEGEYTVSVETQGGQGGAVTVRVLPGETTEVPPLSLGAAGQITGLVSDLQTGQPIAGARVMARNTPWYGVMEDNSAPGVAEGLGSGPSRQDNTEPTTAEPPRVTTTAADGAFRFGGVAPGPYSIEVSIAGYEGGETGSWVEPGRTGTADVMLRRIDPNNATLSGQVTTVRDGATSPLSQVRIELWPNFDDGGQPRPLADLPNGAADLDSPVDPFYMPPFFDIRTAFSDEQGGYALRNIPPGEYRLTFRRYGYTDVERTVTLGTAAQRTENALLDYRLTTVSGRVMLPGGTVPAVGAEVWAATYGYALPARQNGEGGGVGGVIYPYPVGPGTAVTDAQGRFTIEVEAGQVSIGSWHSELGYTYQELTVPLGGLTGVTLVLEPYDTVPPDGGGGGGGTEPGDPGNGR